MDDVDDMRKSVAYYKKLPGGKPAFQSPERTKFKIGDHGLCLHARGGKRIRPTAS